jgi:hypothetical protein
MGDQHVFEREEVQFMHDDEDFVYSFHRFDNGKITFKRLFPSASAQEGEVVIYPCGKKYLANTAVIVLYKAAASGQQLSGFLPNVLRTMLDLYLSKETLLQNLSKAILSFQVNTAIASIEEVMEFIEPYAPWAVHSQTRRDTNM